MILRKHILLVFSVLFSTVIIAQEVTKVDEALKNEIIERRIEQIDTEDVDIDFTVLFDALYTYYDNPINLNRTSSDELNELSLLNDIQINALLDHIDKNGKLLNIYELQSIQGFNSEVIKNILPFVSVSGDIDQANWNFKDALKNGKNDIFLRYISIIEDQKGFSDVLAEDLEESPNSRYLGSRDKLYLRYRFKFHNHISWGLTAEKDAGEEFFQGTQKNGFDFYSAHLYIADYGKIKRAIVGDFHAQFGQGLTLWTGRAFGKSIDLLSTKKNGRGIRPYTSVDENVFLRGAAATVRLGKLDLSLISSFKKVDANILDTLDNNEFVFSSLQLTGIHATPGELQDKDAIDQTVIAGNLGYNTRRLSVGITAARTTFGGDFTRRLGVYNQFEFNSNESVKIGLDYNTTFKNVNLFGEASRSDNGGVALMQGLLIALDEDLSLVALYRNYDRDFHVLNSAGIAESSRSANEKGLLIGIESKFGKAWKLAGYFDQFQFPWLRFQTDAPSEGMEAIAQLTWKPKRGTELYFRYRTQTKPRNTRIETAIDYIVPKTQNNYRFNFSFKVSDAIRLKSRVELTDVTMDNTRSNGILIFQDITYKALSSPFSFSLRYAMFDTDDYDSRIYAYENEVLYYFSTPAYDSQGSRYYISTKYRVSRNVDLWVRWSQWLYENRETISSGLNEIVGDTKSEIKLQLRIKF